MIQIYLFLTLLAPHTSLVAPLQNGVRRRPSNVHIMMVTVSVLQRKLSSLVAARTTAAKVPPKNASRNKNMAISHVR